MVILEGVDVNGFTTGAVGMECCLTVEEDGSEDVGPISRADVSHFAFKASLICCNFLAFLKIGSDFNRWFLVCSVSVA